jgi:plasmid stabilization system protein ParE
LSKRAIREIDRASAWWRTHREKAPHAFDDDTNAAFESLRVNPNVGKPLRARRPGVRSLWLERIGYFVYYRIHDDGMVMVLAIWHAARGSRPKL